MDADCADYADGFKSIAVRNLNHRWPKTNAVGGCERSVIPLPFIKLLPSAFICVICVQSLRSISASLCLCGSRFGTNTPPISGRTPPMFDRCFGRMAGYNAHRLRKDLIAGDIVGIVALPLALAFAIASGVPPERGLYTAMSPRALAPP